MIARSTYTDSSANQSIWRRTSGRGCSRATIRWTRLVHGSSSCGYTMKSRWRCSKWRSSSSSSGSFSAYGSRSSCTHLSRDCSSFFCGFSSTRSWLCRASRASFIIKSSLNARNSYSRNRGACTASNWVCVFLRFEFKTFSASFLGRNFYARSKYIKRNARASKNPI